MADEVRADFEASFTTLKQMAETSGVARRSLPVLERLHDGVANSPKAPGAIEHAVWDFLLGQTA